ncbi:peptide ABC transporter substrate-binding protein [Secundilactobacillus yichangensis]|uniref:peptide ABC transporter substrate-binding protein n=1 Tax=Secundilactobacillus yichangensis TaxID=2799580 RepID=UPI0019433467|nr:peptide ABC transporter substrate-binding protein [Secundilactobacillus yichangensis]
MKHGKYISLAVVGLSGLTLAGCASSYAASGVSQSVNMMSQEQVGTLDTAMVTQIQDLQLANNTQEGLYQLKNSTDVTPGVAKSLVKPTDNGTVYTFHLRSDAKWSNGDPVTAQDFVYGWRRTVTPKTKSSHAYLYAPIKNATAIAAGKKSPSSLGVKALNKDTLQVKLNSATPYFKYLVAFTTFFPQNQKVVEKYGSAYGTSSDKMVYDGPFTLNHWTSSKNSWTLRKNKDYWDKDTVKLNQVNFQVEKDPQTALSQYQAKKLDNITLSGQQAAEEKNNPGYTAYPGGQLDFLALNFNSPALKNKNIRQALSMSINRKALVDNVLKNGSKAPTGSVPAGVTKNPATGKEFTADTDSSATVKYDPKTAQKLWDKGLKQLGTKQVTLNYLGFDGEKDKAEYVQAAAEKLSGLKVNVTLLPQTQGVTRMQSGKGFDMASFGFVQSYPDLSDWMPHFTSENGINMGNYSNKSYDADVNAAATTDAANPQKRYADFQAAEKTLMNDQAVIPLDQGSNVTLNNPKLKNITYAGSSGLYLKNAYLEK